jgi:serine-type D-Ala-D-Ala carboxypeptidase (penicillin-binding protein 5/6)
MFMFWRVCLLFFLHIELQSQQLITTIKTPVAIVVNADTGAVIYEKNSTQRCYPASTTKIATALYILEKWGDQLDKQVTVSADAVSIIPKTKMSTLQTPHTPYQLYPEGMTIFLKPEEKISIRSLLYGHLLASGNDASNVLAEATSGSIPAFIKELNDFLKSKGVKNTHFTNPHGMPHHDHWSTAADMALIAQMCLKNRIFCEIVKTTEYPCPKTNKNPARNFIQSNRLLKKGTFFYSKAIGIKTGFHHSAGYTLVAAARQGKRTLIAVLFQSPDKDQRFKDAIKLFEKAFTETPTTRILFAKNSDTFSKHLPQTASLVKAFIKEDCTISYYPSEEPLFKAQIHWITTGSRIQKNETIGYLELVTQEGKVLQKQPIFSLHTVEKSWKSTIKDHKFLLFSIFLIVGAILYLFKKKSF